MAARATFLAAELRKRRKRNHCHWGAQLQATILCVLFQAQQQANARPHTTLRAEPVHHTCLDSASLPYSLNPTPGPGRPCSWPRCLHPERSLVSLSGPQLSSVEAFPSGLCETSQYGLLLWQVHKEEGAICWRLLVSERIPPPAHCDSSVGNMEHWGADALSFILPLAWMKY